jgi:hypothetical protein
MNTTNNDSHMKEHAGAQKHNTSSKCHDTRWSAPKPLKNEAHKKQAKTSDKTTILAKKQMYSLHQQTYSTY